MAGTIGITLSAQYSNAGDISAITAPNVSVAVTGQPRLGVSTVTLATSDTSLAIGTITTLGYVYFYNLDPTNYIEVGPDGTNWEVKVPPLGIAFFCTDGWTALHAKAHTAACLINYGAFSV